MPSTNTAEQRINKCEDKSLEIKQTVTHKKLGKTEHSIQELWDNFKWSNIHLIDYLGGEEGKIRTEDNI